ncbi:MAG: UMP kinase [Clostridiales bacterium]|nr:MAG: UMP kinase [Clostridiales bacterium]
MRKTYKRVLLKISGEALSGDKGVGIDPKMLEGVSEQIRSFTDKGIEVALVIGGGNFWRGRTSNEMDRSTADYIGMLATVMNALALQDTLERVGIPSRVMSAISMPKVAEPYIKKKAIRHLEKGRVIIFAAGIGNPFFSTDTTAALRACEIEAEIIFLAKNVDAVYSDDPKVNPNAIRYEELTYTEIIEKNLMVMDQTAVTLCKENNIPILVFALNPPENIEIAMSGEKIGTIIKGE